MSDDEDVDIEKLILRGYPSVITQYIIPHTEAR